MVARKVLRVNFWEVLDLGILGISAVEVHDSLSILAADILLERVAAQFQTSTCHVLRCAEALLRQCADHFAV